MHFTMKDMPSCVARGCSARSDKGEVLKIFPRKDLQRRQIWIDRVDRPGWTPTKYSALCERHFDREQWEVPREDGKRKLKTTAVPTIFCVEHPSENDAVAQDHAYCLLGYRQLFIEKDTQEKPEEVMFPIEHIKVEFDENDNFSSECMELEDERWEEEEKRIEDGWDGREGEDVEDIQCTPDISMYPEQGEPFPIEMVECEENEMNAFTSEPSVDPLAFSAEDVLQESVSTVEPHFKHSTKFLFITKDTKYIRPVHVDSEVKGEPVVMLENPSTRATSPLTSDPDQPCIRVKTDLHKSDVLNSSSQTNSKVISSSIACSPPKLKVISQELLRQNPTDITPRFEHSKTNDLEPVPKLLDQPGILINTNLNKSDVLDSLPLPKLKVILQKFFRQNPPDITPPVKRSKLCSKLIEMKNVLQPAPDFLRPKLLVKESFNGGEKLVSLSYPQSSFPKKISKRIALTDRNMKNISLVKSPKVNKSIDQLNNKTKLGNLVVNSMENFAILENIFLEHQYTSKPTWTPATVNGLRLQKDQVSRNFSGKSIFKIIGNNDVKMFMKKKPPDGDNEGVSEVVSQFRKIYPKPDDSGSVMMPNLKYIPTITSSSVVILNPFNKSNSSNLFNPENIILPSAEKQKVKFYECQVCKFSFLTLTALHVHLTSHEDSNVTKGSISDGSRTDSSDEVESIFKLIGSDDVKMCKKKTPDDDNKGIPEIFSRFRKIISKPGHARSSPSQNEATKDEKVLEIDKSEVQNNVNTKEVSRKQIVSNGRVIKIPRRYENGIVSIPNLNSLKGSNKGEFLRLSSLFARHSNSKKLSKKAKISMNKRNLRQKSPKIDEIETSDVNAKTEIKQTEIADNVSETKEVGKRYSLRTKGSLLQPKLLPKKTRTKTKEKAAPPTKNNPIVLIPRLDLRSCNKITKRSLVSNKKGHTDDTQTNYSKSSKQTKQISDGKKCSGKSPKSSEDKTKPSLEVKCPNCKVSVPKDMLKSHSLIHNKLDYQCELCKERFEKRFQLRQHLSSSHTVVFKFRCSRRDCSRKFETKRELDKHSRIHKK